jgi:MoxR-like ATPase
VDEFRAMQARVEEVHVAPVLHAYAVATVRATRKDPQLEVGASPRGSLALLKLSRARALLSGRDFVSPDDMREVAVSALAHRVVLRPEAWARQISAADVVRDVVNNVPTPSWEP